jgi:GTP-binding protein
LKWSSLTDGFFTKNPNIDRLCAVAQLVDSRIGPTNDDDDMIDYLNHAGIPYFLIATKVDKLNATERAENLAALSAHPLLSAGTPILPFSARTGEGRDEVLRTMGELCGIRIGK